MIERENFHKLTVSIKEKWLGMFVCIWLILIPNTIADSVDFYIMNVTPTQLTPGDTFILNITIANLGIDYAAYVNAILDPDSKSPLHVLGSKKVYVTKTAFEGKSTMYFGLILQNERFTISYPIYVDEDTTVGAYSVPLKLVWKNAQMKEQTQTLEFGIKVSGKPEIVIAGINQSPSILYPDTTFTFVLNFENIGTTKAENVKVELSLPQGITGENIDFLGTIEKNSKASAIFSLKTEKEVKTGPNEINFKLEYTFQDGKKQIKKNVVIFIFDKEPPRIEIAGLDTSPSKIEPGKSLTLSLQLENIGEQDAKAVKVEILPFPQLTGRLTSYLGTIKKDDTSTAIFDLEVSSGAKPGKYPIQVKIYYIDDKNKLHVEEKKIYITINSENRLNVKMLWPIGVILLLFAFTIRRKKVRLIVL